MENYLDKKQLQRKTRLSKALGDLHFYSHRYAKTSKGLVIDWWLTDVDDQGRLYYPRQGDPNLEGFPEVSKL